MYQLYGGIGTYSGVEVALLYFARLDLRELELTASRVRHPVRQHTNIIMSITGRLASAFNRSFSSGLNSMSTCISLKQTIRSCGDGFYTPGACTAAHLRLEELRSYRTQRIALRFRSAPHGVVTQRNAPHPV